jgi:hypothetical protein
LRRARKTNNPPESRTTADTAEAPSISGATTSSAKAELAAPASNKLKASSLYTIFSSDDFAAPGPASCVYFLRRARRISNPPESRTTAETAEAPSISGATTLPANAKLPALSNKQANPKNFDTFFSSDEVAAPVRRASFYFLRRARRISSPPESSTTADAAEAPSISGATTPPANATFAAPTSNRLKPTSLDMIFSSERNRNAYITSCAYFLRRARITSNPPESSIAAVTVELPSISGAATA